MRGVEGWGQAALVGKSFTAHPLLNLSEKITGLCQLESCTLCGLISFANGYTAIKEGRGEITSSVYICRTKRRYRSQSLAYYEK
jgi:hypothetical protein